MKVKIDLLIPLTILLPLLASAQTTSKSPDEPVVQLDPYRVAGSYTGLYPKPATTSSVVSAEEAQTYNVIVVEDALKYLPNLAFRRRFVGDLNSGVGIRGTQHSMTARTIVNVDGLLLSNFLGNGLANSPRWSLVAPEEIDRTELIYGPYSALYSGNSLGGVINLTTKTPERFQANAKATVFFHEYHEYGSDDVFRGENVSVSVGNRHRAFSYFLFYNRLRNEAHPVTFRQVLIPVAPTPAGTPTVVTGAYRDFDLTGKDRFVYGQVAPTETAHDLVKLKLGYALSEQTQLRATVSWWGGDEDLIEPASYLKNAAGQPVYSGLVQLDGFTFSVPAADFNISYRHRENVLGSLALEHRMAGGWEFSALGSAYRVNKDISRASSTAAPLARNGGPGLITREGDSGWNTFDLRAASPALDGGHALIFGYHYDGYFGETEQFNASDWRNVAARTSLADGSYGKTATQALFAQDAWTFSPEWKLTAGLRAEQWRAYGGAKSRDIVSTGVRQRTAFAVREKTNLSPKGTLSFRPAESKVWEVRFSLARATRYPTQGELFQGSLSTTGGLTRNDPNLRPEIGFSKDLTVERALAGGAVRLSVFEDSVKDTLFSQLNTSVTPQVTNFQNLDDVRTRGVEASYEKRRFFTDVLDFYSNVSFTDAVIRSNAGFPASNGKILPRVPKWQAKALFTLRPAKAWVVTAGARYASTPYYNLDNSDFRATYGGTNSYLFVESKVSWQGPLGLTLSLGVDNITSHRYYVFHPMPLRTTFLEAAWQY